jgi:isopropylmalate/homocitrate/citramalate synthase
MLKHSDLIYDWNNVPGASFKPAGKHGVLLNDESLRDGLQSPSVKDPAIEKKIEILHLMESLGINSLNLGLPGAGPRAVADIEGATFIGSSPIRRYTENWTDDFLLQTTEQAVKYARSLDLDVMYVTEDTTRCDPETIKRLYSTAIRNGARSIVICDTCGHVTPSGVTALIKFVMDEVVKPSGEDIRVDWHGHSDRGLAVPNSLAALAAGADCVHATALGIGERVGNTQMDQMLVNLKLMGVKPWADQDLTNLGKYCQAVSENTGVPIPLNYPVFGGDAFRTATGVHAAAVIKAFKKNDVELANTVYSGVPAHFFGLEQIIDIGPMSGKSNVIFWLERHGITPTDEMVERIFAKAKQATACLTKDEIYECCGLTTKPLA